MGAKNRPDATEIPSKLTIKPDQAKQNVSRPADDPPIFFYFSQKSWIFLCLEIQTLHLIYYKETLHCHGVYPKDPVDFLGLHEFIWLQTVALSLATVLCIR